jgi:hypothetical protein
VPSLLSYSPFIRQNASSQAQTEYWRRHERSRSSASSRLRDYGLFLVQGPRGTRHVEVEQEMSGFISEHHPLRALFTELVQTRLLGTAQLNDVPAARYIAGVLADFCHVDNLYTIRNSKGKRLEDVGEMLIASNPVLEGRSFIYEREVRKHIGDYTLFLAGIFPEYVARIHRQKSRLDSFVDYLKAGKESYSVLAAFDQFEFKHEAPLFRRLADRFELCVFGLNLVKEDLERVQNTPYDQMRKMLT